MEELKEYFKDALSYVNKDNKKALFLFNSLFKKIPEMPKNSHLRITIVSNILKLNSIIDNPKLENLYLYDYPYDYDDKTPVKKIFIENL